MRNLKWILLELFDWLAVSLGVSLGGGVSSSLRIVRHCQSCPDQQ